MRRVDVARRNTGSAAVGRARRPPRLDAVAEVSGVRRDADALSWPRARRARAVVIADACATFVHGAALVLAPESSVARWARQPIAIGHPGFALTPVVISYDDLPRITRPTEGEVPELAVLSARAHPELEVARAAAIALASLPEEPRALYWNFLMTVLPDWVRQALEAEMNPAQIQNAIAEMSFERGIERGIEQGRTEALRTVAVALATTKLGPRFDAMLDARVRSAAAPDLDALLEALIASSDPAGLLAALARLP